MSPQKFADKYLLALEESLSRLVPEGADGGGRGGLDLGFFFLPAIAETIAGDC